MPKLTTDGLDGFLATLNSLGESAVKVAKQCVYAGAGEIHGAMEKSVLSLPLDSDGFTPDKDPLRVITDQDRRDLAACLGYSKIDDSDGVSVSVSFDGYISRKEKNFPKGVPAALIARSMESGSSVRAKNPFVRKSVNSVRATVPTVMQAKLDEVINKITAGKPSKQED